MPPWQYVETKNGVNSGDGVAVSTHRIEKTGGVNATFDAGAASVQKIEGDGFVEFLAGAPSYRAIGFSVDDPGTTRDEIDFAIYMRNDATGISLMANGVIEANLGIVYAAGDVMRLQRVGTMVTAWRNGELVHTFANQSNGSILVDTSMFNTAGVLDGIRLYDATTKSWPALTWQGVANVTITAGASHRTRRLTFEAPTKMRPGDQLVAILASQGPEQVSATSVPWDYANAFTSETNKRGCAVYRRIVTDDEPTEYSFDLNVRHETLGALFVFRSLDNSVEWVGGSGVDFAAATTFPFPSRTLFRYSDLFLGIAFTRPTAGGMFSPPGGVKIADFSQSALGGTSCSLRVFYIALEAVGATDTQRATDGTAQSGMAASVALQGLPAIGDGLSWSPIVSGAIGLPTEGI